MHREAFFSRRRVRDASCAYWMQRILDQYLNRAFSGLKNTLVGAIDSDMGECG